MFSQEHADFAANFFEGILRHTTDEWHGQPFLLAPWQEEALSQIFGQVDEDERRIIETVYLEVPKKSGKTELAAGIVLYVLVMTDTPGCQVYGVGAATRQALNVYRAACKMVEQSRILSKRLRILRGTHRIIKRSDPDSFYAAIAADGDMGDGVNPACTVADEVHRWRTRKQFENWDVLANGGITRRQTLTVAITTAGVQNESPLAWRLHEKARKIQQGVVSDPKFYGRIYAADCEDDPGDPQTWIKANPSLRENGGFVNIEKIREKYVSHVAEGDLTSFKRYYLNIWDDKEQRAIDMAKWDASSGPWKMAGLLPKRPDERVRPLPDDLMEYFRKRRCIAGVDAMATDLAAVAFVFPWEDDAYDVLPFFWLPEKGIPKRELRDGLPYGQWIEQGFLESCPGEVIDYREIKARLEWGDQIFDLREICFDAENARELSTPLLQSGYPCHEMRQVGISLSEPSKKLLELVSSGKLHHGGHPLLWACQAVAFWISGKVAPLGRPISSRIVAPLLSARGALARAGFLPALAAFFRAVVVLAPLAPLWPLGAPFFWVAPFFEEGRSGATWAPGSAKVTAVSVVSLVILAFGILSALGAHDDGSLRWPGKARQF